MRLHCRQCSRLHNWHGLAERELRYIIAWICLCTSLGERRKSTLPDIEQDLQRRTMRRLEAIASKVRRRAINITVRAEWDFPPMKQLSDGHCVSRRISSSVRTCGRHHVPALMRPTTGTCTPEPDPGTAGQRLTPIYIPPYSWQSIHPRLRKAIATR